VIEVDLEALGRQARSVEALADDLEAAVARWRTALSDACAPSVAAVREAYVKEFAVHGEALRSWAEAARTAADTYDAADRP
jgi:hypothetical protein